MTDQQCWTATISRIDPIPNKDRIVLATIDGYQAIVPIDHYKVGDTVCYISEQSILPDTLITTLGLDGRLAGAGKNRVKAIKMGGVVSQGIICTPDNWQDRERHLAGGQQVPELDAVLGVTKYQPEIPIHLRGAWSRPRGDAPIIPMYDIENIKKMRHWKDRNVVWDSDKNVVVETLLDTPYWDDPFNGHQVVVTEKLHGTNVGMHMNADDHILYVYSKGVGARGFALVEDDVNLYWKMVRKHPAIEKAMHDILRHERAITVFGEIFGKGVQDMGYGLDDIQIRLFGVRLWNRLEDAFWYDAWESPKFADLSVPVIYRGLYDYDRIVDMATCPSEIGGGLREGVVVTSTTQPVAPNGRRNSAKFINPAYLVRGGDATEYN